MRVICRRGINIKNSLNQLAKQRRNSGVLAKWINRLWASQFLRLPRYRIRSIYNRIRSSFITFGKRRAYFIVSKFKSIIREQMREVMLEEKYLLSSGSTHQQPSIRAVLMDLLDKSNQSANRFFINCGKDKVMFMSGVGPLICSSQDTPLLAYILPKGDLERGTRLFIGSTLQPGDIYIDVGANVGMHVIAAGQAMKGQGKIYALEPYPPTVELLKENVLIHGLKDIVQIIPAAASFKKSEETFYLGITSGHHSLYPLEDTSGLGNELKVQTVVLDNVVEDESVTLIKIDVEGAEIDVIKGAERLLSNRNTGLIIELGFSHLKRRGITLEEWFDLFEKKGMVYKVIDDETGRLNEVKHSQLTETNSSNLFFYYPDSQKWGTL